jgi:diamine N-acetyltransferase
MRVELVPIDDSNREQALALAVAPGQEQFVATVEESFLDAREHPEGSPWMRLVLADGIPSAFVMLSWDAVPDPPRVYGPWYLWRLLVDAGAQGRGIGRAVVEQVAALIREEGATELLTSYVDAPGGPEGFYLGLGFEPTGEVDPDGEILLRLPLA